MRSPLAGPSPVGGLLAEEQTHEVGDGADDVEIPSLGACSGAESPGGKAFIANYWDASKGCFTQGDPPTLAGPSHKVYRATAGAYRFNAG
ncbi:hypothetical protein [Streptomyces griseiscabiei]|uniref:Uncharacterized protein n=1 Tax=Streptomyces griseiscabiei TaxID=2993540 RepID=A0ABU4L3D9_9ACTN|nr:hypothetical protein [Streptomyces griseiscabiei]MBZ3901262.1 hypothetical protein [Streptomyces griseiscabiei]MDX2910187.1 hypothetical protein [Streptomyces griseiscabiei]